MRYPFRVRCIETYSFEVEADDETQAHALAEQYIASGLAQGPVEVDWGEAVLDFGPFEMELVMLQAIDPRWRLVKAADWLEVDRSPYRHFRLDRDDVYVILTDHSGKAPPTMKEAVYIFIYQRGTDEQVTPMSMISTLADYITVLRLTASQAETPEQP